MGLRLRSIAALVIGLLVVQLALVVAGVGALYVARRYFPTRFDMAEQVVLSRWLRPQYLGDGRPASELLLCYPMGLAVNQAGELLISDRGRDRRGRVVWRIDSKGIAHIVAGTGRRGKATGRRALELDFDRPEGLAVAHDGSVFLSDGFNHAVYRITPDGGAERFAGTGSPGFSGDGGIASNATLFRPADLRLDRKGNLYIADVQNHRVRKVDPAGRITTVAGTGKPGFSPDGTLAATAQLDTPWGLGLDLQDRLLIGDGGNHRVRRVDDDGRLVTLAGSGRRGFAGDGGPATQASLNWPEGLFMDPGGRLFIGDEWNNAVRVVDTNGTISTVIGTGFPGRAFIGGVARASPVDDPENILGTADGLIVTDGNNGRVIRISDAGIIELVAGRGEIGPCAPRL
jgi:DNA-binding beta-propeller fold protein YncE